VKEIGNIFLCWRQGPGCRRYIVGVLKKSSLSGVRFTYISSGVEKAILDGFTCYTEFPDTTKEYTDNVLEIFGQRLVKSERSDFSEFLSFWEIQTKFKEDKYYLLAHTQGLSAIDNFEFLADYNTKKDLCFLTDIASLSQTKLPPNTINIGDELRFELEKRNEYDSCAVKVFKDELHIGYIKQIHSRVFYKCKGNHLKLTVKAIEKNGIVKKLFVKVSF
jgi:hypothetical protein